MCLYHKIRAGLGLLALGLLLSLSAVPALAAPEKKAQTIRLVPEGEYVKGKVNDPVTKNAREAFILCRNPEFHLESEDGSLSSAEIIVYCNEYVEGEDKGVRNRILRKTVSLGESVQLLPDSVYEEAEESGELYDFINRCYMVRVYTGDGTESYTDSYFGIVDENIYSEKCLTAQKEAEAAAQRIAELGPAGVR